MAAITVTYSGSTILTTDASGTKALKTAGKYCLGNIAVQFSPPAPASNKIDEIINRTISTYTNDNVTTIGIFAFGHCSSLTIASFPACTTISNYAFYACSSLTTVSFPKCTTTGGDAFAWCRSLTTASFPKCTQIGTSTFAYCSNLTTASFPACTTIYYNAFQNCIRLKSLYLTNSSVATLSNSNAFSSTPIGGYSAMAGTIGSIYVPASLLTSYKAATNWTYFSSRFVGI